MSLRRPWRFAGLAGLVLAAALVDTGSAWAQAAAAAPSPQQMIDALKPSGNRGRNLMVRQSTEPAAAASGAAAATAATPAAPAAPQARPLPTRKRDAVASCNLPPCCHSVMY